MTKTELYQRKDVYLQGVEEQKALLQHTKDMYEKAIIQWQEVCIEKDNIQHTLDEIRELAEGLGSLPTLTKLRAFLQTIKELIKTKAGE